jgi:SSS family solute:Na+ symporter
MSSLALFATAEPATNGIFSLSTIDYVVVTVYFAAVIGLGFYLKKYAATSEEFFMAGRKMTAWVAGLSFISANLSSMETMGWSAMAYQYGMVSAHAYLIGAIPAILFLAVVMLPFYYVCKTHSVPGYLGLRYGEDSRVLAGLSFTFMTVLVCGANMYAMAIMLKMILGWNIHVSIWASSITVAVYVTLGGVLSAILNEVLQFFLIWLGTLLVPILGLYEAGGWSGMMEKVQGANSHADFTSLWASMGSANDNPMGMHWVGLVFGWGFAASFGYWCTDFLQVQRVLTARSLRDAQNGTIIGAAFKMLVPIIVIVPGILGLALLMPTMGIKLLPEDQAIMTGGYSYNQVLPLMMSRYLGPGLLGLGVTGMIAGFMSGMAGNVSAFSTVWTYDVYRQLIRRNASDGHYVEMGRWCSIVGVIIAIGTAYAVMLFTNILAYFLVLVLFFIVPLFGVVIMGMLWKQATKAGGFWGLLLGTLASVAMYLFVHWFPAGYATLLPQDLKDLPALAQQLERPQQPATRFIASKLSPETVAILAEYLKSQEAKAQPASWWEKLAEACKEDDNLTLKLRIALVGDLNRLLNGPLLYDPQRFAGADFGKKSHADAKKTLDGQWLAQHNRALLNAVFGNELAHMRRVEPTQINPRHAEIIAASSKAQDITVNMFSAFWSLLLTVGTVVMVSMFTTPKADVGLKDLVYGLTLLPDEGHCPWYKQPAFWAAMILIVLVAVNVVFW